MNFDKPNCKMLPPATFEMMKQYYVSDEISRIMPRTNMFFVYSEARRFILRND
jgi:hypothetical protein